MLGTVVTGVESVDAPVGPQTISPPPFMPMAVVAGALTHVVVDSPLDPPPLSSDRTVVLSDEQPATTAAATRAILIRRISRSSHAR